MVVATTNYDTLIEEVLTEQGRLPDWGQPPMANPITDVPLDVSNLIGALPRYTPILHLHGRIGWYRRTEGGAPYGASMTNHNENFGTPIVMLPDPEKDYASDSLINDLWTQFESVLSRAKLVFVLGHSLNDKLLRGALATLVRPLQRIAVAVYSADGQQPHESTAELQRIIREELTGAVTIPMYFGSALNWDAFQDYLNLAERGGLL